MTISFQPATSADAALETFDFTKLSAINTCPTWGIMRYGMHRSCEGGQRAMALEAGSAMHLVFAAVRLIDLYETQPLIATTHCRKLFSEANADEMIAVMSSSDDLITRARTLALNTLHASGFYDSPDDKRRTMQNLEEAALAYVDRWDWSCTPNAIGDPVLVEGNFVGIEIAFDIRVDGIGAPFRFTGRIDGVHRRQFDPSLILVEENKTASRLGQPWMDSFEMSHQVTGYCVALSTILGRDVRAARVRGLSIPLPRSYDAGGVVSVVVDRTDDAIRHWVRWLEHTINLYRQHKEDVVNAPRYTHSCNRYFRMCSMLPFCMTPDEEKREFINQMAIDEWSPLKDDSSSGD